MPLYIQDPDDPSTTFLFEALLQACDGATRGAGAFAWATEGGIKLLLEADVFKEFASAGEFDLVVGLDSVTNTKALEALRSAQDCLPGLTIRAFMHDRAALFHPKILWLLGDGGGTVVVGSGNLTDGGLRGNWEGFYVDSLDESEASMLESQWSDWVDLHESNLFDLSDPEVVARAKQNRGGWPGGKGPAKKKRVKESGKRVAKKAPTAAVTPSVLVAEIPASGDRWKQANFDLDNYQNFFGAKVGTQTFIFLNSVDRAGTIGPTESRPSVAVKSRNFRFELAAVGNRPYPAKGRPIGVFLRTAARTFLYQLVMPGETGHAKLSSFLNSKWHGRSDRMKRVRATRSELQNAWPNSPLLKAAISLQSAGP